MSNKRITITIKKGKKENNITTTAINTEINNLSSYEIIGVLETLLVLEKAKVTNQNS